MNEIKTQLLTEKKGREDVESDIARLKAQLNGVLEENKKLIKDSDLRVINEQLTEKKHHQDQDFDEETSKTKTELIQNLELEKSDFFRIIENDALLQGLRKDNADLHERAKEEERKLNEANYEALQYETLTKLSNEQKDLEIETRKKLQVELEKWKDQLEETVKNNELKVQKKLRESESADIKQAQAKLLKEERELADLKKKYLLVEEAEKNYIIDENNRKRHLELITAKQDELTTQNEKLREELDILLHAVEELDEKANFLKGQIEQQRIERAKNHKELHQVEEEHIVLLSKYEHMSNTIKFDDDMKKFDIEELRSVVQNNNFMNDSINEFMQKWDFLKKFSKLER